jgi:hypothetical protein
MIDNCIRGFLSKVGIINTQIAIKPACLQIRIVPEAKVEGREDTSFSTRSAGMNPFDFNALMTIWSCSSFPVKRVSVYPVFS